jgi:toxin ParE1/3/4
VPKVRILQQAAEEAEAAAGWYENERQGLGTEFAEAIESAIDVIEDGFLPLSPMPGNSGGKGAKRLILRRFPYDIVVVERSDELIVVAFAHHSRKPGYWRDRTSP